MGQTRHRPEARQPFAATDAVGIRAGELPLAARVLVAARHQKAFYAALLATLLVAFLWQSVATATHLHFPPGTFADTSVRTGATPQVTAPKAPGELPINCSLCHDAAIAGHFLSPGAILLAVPLPAAPWRRLCVPFLLKCGGARSHAWRSRAPPKSVIARLPDGAGLSHLRR